MLLGADHAGLLLYGELARRLRRLVGTERELAPSTDHPHVAAAVRVAGAQA